MTHLAPGGWFELAEIGTACHSDDNSVPDDWAPKRCFDLAREALGKVGRIALDGDGIKKLLIDAGFVDVEVSWY